MDWVQSGWPGDVIPSEFRPYKSRQSELSVLKGCLLWGPRVVVPHLLRSRILDLLCEGHPGINRMKALARSYVWWPGLDEAVTNKVQHCSTCQLSRPSPPATCPGEWEDTNTPWSRLHIDLAGPFQGKNLVLVDSFSKWVELVVLKNTTSESVCLALDSIFASHGFPDTLVSDNGPQFTSSPFELFLAHRGIRHALISPFHPASNGLAERAVRSAKEALGRLGEGDWPTWIARYLLAQHTTPSTATNLSPAELLMGRKLRITLDCLHPRYTPRAPLDSSSKIRVFCPGDPVYSRNYSGAPLWVPGWVEQQTGPKSYRIRLGDGRLWRRHVDQLRSRWSTPTGAALFDPETSDRGEGEATDSQRATPEQQSLAEDLPDSSTSEALSPQKPASSQLMQPTGERKPTPSQEEITAPSAAPVMPPLPTRPRRSDREKRRPAYLSDYACTVLGERSVECGSSHSGLPFTREPKQSLIG
uniref:Gypsy retrotransposon integrase-like protein 1 n=1 Tax=Naja naja TaxID=35670 RepID=A0A8C6X3W4_NAJNA